MKSMVANLKTKRGVRNVLLEVGVDALMIVIGISIAYLIKMVML